MENHPHGLGPLLGRTGQLVGSHHEVKAQLGATGTGSQQHDRPRGTVLTCSESHSLSTAAHHLWPGPAEGSAGPLTGVGIGRRRDMASLHSTTTATGCGTASPDHSTSTAG